MAVHRSSHGAAPRLSAALSLLAALGLLAACAAPQPGTLTTTSSSASAARSSAPPTAAVEVAPLLPAVDHAFPPNGDEAETPSPAGEEAAEPESTGAAEDAATEETATAAPESEEAAPANVAPFTPTGSPQERGAQLPEPTPSGDSAEGNGAPGSAYFFAVAVPFLTLQDDISFDEVETRWRSGEVLTSESGMALLPTLLGEPGEGVRELSADALLAALEDAPEAIALIGFEQIDPRFKILTVDGANLLSNQLAAGEWPLLVESEGAGNRDPAQLTTLVMTGVTAMARGTADATERSGSYAYPAEIIGPELALADITHVSNEIPFIEGCVVMNVENNLTLCSKPEYWAALEFMGTDIVGLSGNHVNDFGRDGARESLGWYKENNIPIYGSGITVDEACAPLLWEHNGNTFAFVAALAYGPKSAWVTDEEPGACSYYEHRDRILNTIAALAGEVDIVAVELQYEETYFAYPTPSQVEEFRDLRAAGADLVTGVQSHVPQAQEPYGAFDAGGPGMISYGLGNLYFDQMWSWETRSELYLRHTIYNGQIINSEILTGVLEDFAQPRWATPSERELILSTIFDGTPARP